MVTMGKVRQEAGWWEQTPFLKLLPAWMAGILVADAAVLPSFPLWVGAGISLLLLVATTSNRLRLPAWMGDVAVFGVLFATACLWTSSGDRRRLPNSLQHHADQPVLATLVDDPKPTGATWRLHVAAFAALSPGSAAATSGDGLVYIANDGYPMLFGKGDTVLLPPMWELPLTSPLPGTMDMAAYCRRNHIDMLMRCHGREVRLYGTCNPTGLSLPEQIHRRCAAVWAENIADPTAASLLQAMIVGDDAHLDPEVRAAWTDTGIVHIMVVSGSNLALVLAGVGMLLFWLRHEKYRWVKMLVALPLVWLYVMVTGSGPAAVRAGIMFTVVAIGLAANRTDNSLNRLAAAAFVALIVEPEWLFAPGMQLSLVAVLSLVLFYSGMANLLPVKNRFLNLFWRVAVAGIAAELLTAPLVVYYFHNFPAFFLPANIGVFVFAELVQFLGLFIIAASVWQPLAVGAGKLVGWLVVGFNKCVFLMQAATPQQLKSLWISGLGLAAVYVVIFGMAAIWVWGLRVCIRPLLAACCLCCAIAIGEEWQVRNRKMLLLYAGSGGAWVEYVERDSACIVYRDQVLSGKAQAMLDNAIKSLGVCSLQTDTARHAFILGGQRVVLVSHASRAGRAFPTDVAVVLPGAVQPASAIAACYAPRVLYLMNSTRHRSGKSAQDTFRMVVHYVGEEGGAVME